MIADTEDDIMRGIVGGNVNSIYPKPIWVTDVGVIELPFSKKRHVSIEAISQPQLCIEAHIGGGARHTFRRNFGKEQP